MSRLQLSYEFLEFLASQNANNDQHDASRVPTLNDLSKSLGVSVAYLREQLEVAKAIGLVEVRPRTGIRKLPYSFFPAVRQSLNYAVAVDRNNFMTYSDLRNHIEAAYWEEAARKLTAEDHTLLKGLIEEAWRKLNGQPIRIPHAEHRELHLTIFKRLENPFVLGLLEAYWEVYEAVGLNLYADYDYLKQVWNYHHKMVDSICNGDFITGYQAMIAHNDLLFHRPQSYASSDVNPS